MTVKEFVVLKGRKGEHYILWEVIELNGFLVIGDAYRIFRYEYLMKRNVISNHPGVLRNYDSL